MQRDQVAERRDVPFEEGPEGRAGIKEVDVRGISRGVLRLCPQKIVGVNRSLTRSVRAEPGCESDSRATDKTPASIDCA